MEKKQKTYVLHDGTNIRKVLRCHPSQYEQNIRPEDLVIVTDENVSGQIHYIKDGKIEDKTKEMLENEELMRVAEINQRIKSYYTEHKDIISAVKTKYPEVIELLVSLNLVNTVINEI